MSATVEFREGASSANNEPSITMDEALRRTKKMLVDEDLAREPVLSTQVLRGALPEGLDLKDEQIAVLNIPIQKKYFCDVGALVDGDELVKAKTVAGLRDKIWDGIPDENKCDSDG
jgi:hypothetical protein